MIFHLVAIREFFDQKFTIDVLVFWVSEKFLREICSEYKLVVLELYEYNKEKVESFWKIKMLLNYNETDVILLSNASDLEGILYWFYVLWFNIVNINYVDDRKLDQEHVHNIIAQTKAEADAWLKEKVAEKKLEKKKAITIIDEEELPESKSVPEEENHMSWWWLLILLLLGATGYEMYKKHQEKKEEREAAELNK